MRQRIEGNTLGWLFATLWFASSIALLPMPATLIWWQPDWLLLTLAIWGFAFQGRLPLMIVFIAGCYQDILLNTLLGAHALGYLAAIYAFNVFYPRIRYYTLFQSTLIMTLLVGISELIQLWLAASQGALPRHLMVWGTTLTTLVGWPLLICFSKKAFLAR